MFTNTYGNIFNSSFHIWRQLIARFIRRFRVQLPNFQPVHVVIVGQIARCRGKAHVEPGGQDDAFLLEAQLAEVARSVWVDADRQCLVQIPF